MSKKIKIEDIVKYRIPGSLCYSPDGKLLAFQVTSADKEQKEYRTSVFISRDGEAAKQVTWDLDSSVVGWKDETHLIINRKSQDDQFLTSLYLLDVNGGEASPWIQLQFRMIEIKKINDNRFVLSGLIDANNPNLYKAGKAEILNYQKKKKDEADYQVVDEAPFWMNGSGFTNKLRTALFLVDIVDGESKLRRLTAPFFRTVSFCVDGNDIYYSGHSFRRKDVRVDKVFCYHTETGLTENVYSKKDHGISGLFTIDHQLYALATDYMKYGLNQTRSIVRVDYNSLDEVFIPEVSLSNRVISDTVHGAGKQNAVIGSSYLTLATIEDHNAIFEFDNSFNCKKIWEESGMADSMAVCTDKIAICYQDWQNLCEIYEMNREGSGMRKISFLNDDFISDRYVARPYPVDYVSEDNKLRGWVLLPYEYDPEKKYPAVLDIHGGPRATYGETFFHEMQVWAADGYIVMFTNIRGSDGRGDAFADIRGKYGDVDYHNLMDFTDAVLYEYPSVDTDRICVTGGSYGGFMTNWIIGHTNRFCCAASQRSISNWISKTFISDIGLYFNPDQNGADGPFDFETLWNHSPLKYAKGAKTPTLFIHSDEDYRCPLPEGIQMMEALAVQNIETRLVIFRKENHELSRSGKPNHRIRRLTEITDWFNKHTK